MPTKEPTKEKEPKVLDVEEQPEAKSPKYRNGSRGGFDGSGNSETGGGYGSNRSEAGDDLAIWHEEQEDEHVRSLYKAEKLLDDVLYRQNMYTLASQHYTYLNNACFTTPSIFITSVSSFLSFLSATDPMRSKDIALAVGLMGTIATILTALRSAFKFDTMAESFRSAAAEYRLLTTRVNSVMRRDKVYPKEWALLWKEVEERMTELEKKLIYSPNRDLVEMWARSGLLSVKHLSGAMMPPWLYRFLQDLEDDGVQSEADVMFIPDELFEQWEQPYYHDHPTVEKKSVYDPSREEGRTRYPKVVIHKLRELRERQIETKSQKKRIGRSEMKLAMKPATLSALKKRGVTTVGDLRLVNDNTLDSVVDELISLEMPPMPVPWARLEEMLQDVRSYGRSMPSLRACYNPAPSERAMRRIARVTEACCTLAHRDAGRASNTNLTASNLGGAGVGRSYGGGGGDYGRGSAASSGVRVW